MGSAWRFLRLIVCIVSAVVAISVVVSSTLRSTYMFVWNRKIASVWPPGYAFVGDSLTLNCDWKRQFHGSYVVNFAAGGTDIVEIAHQIIQARLVKADFIMIDGGINDIMLEDAPIDRIKPDFVYLTQQIPNQRKAIFTLIPYVSNPWFAGKIEAANSTLAALAQTAGLAVIDLNPKLSSDGVRRPEMTTDGVHFTEQACRVWSDEVHAKLESLVPDRE